MFYIKKHKHIIILNVFFLSLANCCRQHTASPSDHQAQPAPAIGQEHIVTRPPQEAGAPLPAQRPPTAHPAALQFHTGPAQVTPPRPQNAQHFSNLTLSPLPSSSSRRRKTPLPPPHPRMRCLNPARRRRRPCQRFTSPRGSPPHRPTGPQWSSRRIAVAETSPSCSPKDCP